MNNQRLGCLGVGLFVALCLSLIANLVLFMVAVSQLSGGTTSLSAGERKLVETEVEPGKGEGKIVLIDLRGMISTSVRGIATDSMVEDLKLALKQAATDEKIKAIVLQIDSPGGEVTASDILYHAVCGARESKPVVVYMNSVAASGGYYTACGGTYLMAAETTITGSIGVIIQTLNYEDLMGKIGLDAVVFKSGKFKDLLSGSRQMTPEETAYVQSLVMQTYDRFVGIVARERKLPLAELTGGIADGRIVSGKDALKAKLIDGIGYVEDAYAKARELGKAPDAAVIRYAAPFRLGNLFRMLGESAEARGKLEIDLSSNLLPRLESGKIYLLPGFYAP